MTARSSASASNLRPNPPLNARSLRTRRALVEAVRVELQERGSFQAEGVVARAECSVATFYGHFPTKDDALAEAFESSLETLLALCDEWLDDGRLRNARLDQVLSGFADELVSYFRRSSLLWRAALGRMAESRRVRSVYRQADRRSLESAQRFVAGGQQRDMIRAGEARVLASALVVIAQGMHNVHLLRPGADVRIRAEVARAMTALLAPAQGDPG